MIRSVVAAVLILALTAFVAVGYLYAYRSQAPGTSVTGDATALLGVAPVAILLAILPLAALFLVVYAAVRLAVRHERNRSTRLP